MARRGKFTFPENVLTHEQEEILKDLTRKAERKSDRIRRSHKNLDLNKRFTRDYSYLENENDTRWGTYMTQVKYKSAIERLKDFLDPNYISRESNELVANFTHNLSELFEINIKKPSFKKFEKFIELFPEYSSFQRPSPPKVLEELEAVKDFLISGAEGKGMANLKESIIKALKSVDIKVKGERSRGRPRKR